MWAKLGEDQNGDILYLDIESGILARYTRAGDNGGTPARASLFGPGNLTQQSGGGAPSSAPYASIVGKPAENLYAVMEHQSRPLKAELERSTTLKGPYKP